MTPDPEQRRLLDRLRTAHRVAGVGSWEGRIVGSGTELDWSAEVNEIAGWPAERPPTYQDFVSLVHPDDRPAFFEARDAAFAGRKPYRMDLRLVRPDGEVRHVHLAAEVVRDPDGTPTRLLGVVQDRTQEIEALRRLRTTEASRRQLLERILDAADHERDRLARHLTSGPIARLQAVEATMASGIGEGAPPAWTDALDSVRRSISSLEATVSSFADGPARRDLAAVVADLAADAAPHLAVEVDLDVAGPLRPALRSVAVRVVQEGLQNARKHAQASTATVTVRDHDGGVLVRVADDGGGFDPDAAHHRHGHFGLASLRDDVAAVGGRLEVASGPHGTVMEALIPAR